MAILAQNEFITDSIRIRNKDIMVRVGMLEQNGLQFYRENPRIYSIICADIGDLSQKEIEEKLQDMDHVKILYHSIKANGGLTDPILVRDGDLVVLEGNSRLAAYRMLAKNDPIRWGKIKCQILPKEIDDSDIFTLLGDYHIIGKKDWAPYEQAGYLYRRCKRHKASPEIVAKELGMSPQEVNHLIEVYEFMLKYDETDITRWSYYYEYFSHRPMQNAREQYPYLDDLIVKKINNKEISKAVDIRDKLNIIAKSPKTLKAFVNEEKDLERSYESALSRGAGEAWYSRLHKFRNYFADESFSEDLSNMKESVRDKCIFGLKKIVKRVEAIINKYEEKSK